MACERLRVQRSLFLFVWFCTTIPVSSTCVIETTEAMKHEFLADKLGGINRSTCISDCIRLTCEGTESEETTLCRIPQLSRPFLRHARSVPISAEDRYLSRSLSLIHYQHRSLTDEYSRASCSPKALFRTYPLKTRRSMLEFQSRLQSQTKL